ncbi:hypothetical protein MH928_17395 [Flavobacterium sp. WW92]|uniref:hypothetical protein n=1 Tax=unclassified Flavobacterium TaxID=196869 RepID=UPI0022248894|nr:MULTISPECIES: hypothetical protein [unclassified Flavobacterium]WDO13084.1 hypothetical protein MH928_17395 [Flavobacterium sp. WW92]
MNDENFDLDDINDRVKIVNLIIFAIATRGRLFFSYEDRIAYMFLKSGKVYMRNEYNHENMLIEIDKAKPKHWTHGGTLLALTKDFAEFICKGGKTNHNNGYGGLFSNHWGYPENDMIAIRQKAYKLGYL